MTKAEQREASGGLQSSFLIDCQCLIILLGLIFFIVEILGKGKEYIEGCCKLYMYILYTTDDITLEYSQCKVPHFDSFVVDERVNSLRACFTICLVHLYSELCPATSPYFIPTDM